MKIITREFTLLRGIETGWGCGYVIIPPGHPMHGVHYNDIPVSCHGGLTFSDSASELDWPEITEEDADGWVVGFDTAHIGDTLTKWTDEASVIREAEKLREQLMELA